MKYRQFSERFLATMATGDFDAMGAMLHPDFVVVEAEGLPYPGSYHGAEGWRALSGDVLTQWSGFRLRLLEVLGETEDSLVIRFAISGRSRKTGKSFESSVLELWRFKDDLLVRIDPYYFDTHQLVLANTD